MKYESLKSNKNIGYLLKVTLPLAQCEHYVQYFLVDIYKCTYSSFYGGLHFQ